MSKTKNTFVVLFVLSLILTFIAAGLLFLFTYRPDDIAAGTPVADTENDVTILFCDTDNNNCYTFCLDFNKGEVRTKKLYMDTDFYAYGGKSELLARAKELNGKISRVIAVTETQLCALIDYLGGYPVFVTEHLAKVCGGISEGKQRIVGISAVNIYRYENNNRETALKLSEWLAYGWCGALSDKYAFFKLLKLCDTDISYTDYYPFATFFEKFVDKG